MFPVRYKLNIYILIIRNSVFKGLTIPSLSSVLQELKDERDLVAVTQHSRTLQMLGSNLDRDAPYPKAFECPF
jgi:hypothetical protein